MVWPAVAVIMVLGVGMPLAAWLVGRRLDIRHRPSAVGLGPPASPPDRWLAERHGLTAWQRRQVRQAVLFGRAFSDPVLRDAARGLAGAVLRGEVKMGRGLRLLGSILVVEAAVIIAAGIFVMVGLGSASGVVPVLVGAWLAMQGAVTLWMVRGGAQRACRRNA